MKPLLLLGAHGGTWGFLLVEAHWTEAKLLLQAECVYASNRKAAPVAWQSGAHTQAERATAMEAKRGPWSGRRYFPVSSSTFFTMAPIPSWMWWSAVSHMKAGVVTTLFFWST